MKDVDMREALAEKYKSMPYVTDFFDKAQRSIERAIEFQKAGNEKHSTYYWLEAAEAFHRMAGLMGYNSYDGPRSGS